ncbi:MAG: hypothetical protein SV775_03125, partial [Thermodesulfobacteriota bacterium]|nr:hypothetical protein [Thermodesulfobacteriota bacterium]
ARLEEAIAAFLKDYPHLKGHRQMKYLLESLVVSHHGGQLPYWKVLVETMMNKGFLEAIFSTSTVAAGVNFPARTVALVQSDRYNGREFADLTATELHQMIGRAGRRGKDHIGFVLIIPGLHQDPQLIQDLKDAQDEPIRSQIHINFSMALNLLLSHTPLEVKVVLERSFAAFQEKERGPLLGRRWGRMVTELEAALSGGKCDIVDPYEVLDNIENRSDLQKQIKRMTQSIGHERLVNAYREYLKPGRLILHKNADVYVVIRTYTEGGRFICAAYSVKKVLSARKGRLGLKKVDLAQVEAVFDCQLVVPEDHVPKRIKTVCEAVSLDHLEPLSIEVSDQDSFEELHELRQRINLFPCEGCKHLKICHGRKKSKLRMLLRDLRSIAVQMDGIGGGLWPGFKRHVRFLKDTGFVDYMDCLTPDGYWAAKLRLDQPLLIAEVIRRGILDGVAPEILAGGLAPFVWDRTQEVELRVNRGTFELVDMEEIFNSILDSIEPIRQLKNKRGFESPRVLFWPAAALFLWAKGVPWRQILDLVPVDEGDMASLIMRTVDHLRQVANLKETHPELASVAEEGVRLILREPVYIS